MACTRRLRSLLSVDEREKASCATTTSLIQNFKIEDLELRSEASTVFPTCRNGSQYRDLRTDPSWLRGEDYGLMRAILPLKTVNEDGPASRAYQPPLLYAYVINILPIFGQKVRPTVSQWVGPLIQQRFRPLVILQPIGVLVLRGGRLTQVLTPSRNPK